MKARLCLVAFALLFAGQAMAQQSPWLVRARAVHLEMADKSDQVGGSGAFDRLTVNNKWIPEVDVSYFFTPNIAAELILTVPQKQTVSLAGTEIGTFKHLPPTLLVQYHFTGLQGYKPYVGAGINYTRISQVDLAGGAATLDSHSWGGALQAGVDIPLDKNWSLNFDIKKIYIQSDVSLNGVHQGTLKLDPIAAGVGIGYRF